MAKKIRPRKKRRRVRWLEVEDRLQEHWLAVSGGWMRERLIHE